MRVGGGGSWGSCMVMFGSRLAWIGGEVVVPTLLAWNFALTKEEKISDEKMSECGRGRAWIIELAMV